jgi:hypothetical protein
MSAAITGTANAQSASARTLLYSDVPFVKNPAVRGKDRAGGQAIAEPFVKAAIAKDADKRETYAQMTGLDYNPTKAGNWNCIRFSQFVTSQRGGMVLTAAEAAKAILEGKKVYCEIGVGNPKGFTPAGDESCALLSSFAEFYPFVRNKGMVDGR